MAHKVQWLSPSPMWDEFAPRPDKREFRRPALLRFASDTFMNDFQALLADHPDRVRDLLARGETWRRPGSGPDGDSGDLPLKLYQPAHLRYYLVAATLGCRLPGLPDHKIRLADGERAAFVLRRLVPKNGYTQADLTEYDAAKCAELAWVEAPQGPGWKPVAEAPLPAEERLPMFAFFFQAGDRQRRIMAGLVPVARQQAYAGGRSLAATGQDQPEAEATDPRLGEFDRSVAGPWTNAVAWWNELHNPPAAPANFRQQAQLSIQESSALILLDFAVFLKSLSGRLWAAIEDAAKEKDLRQAEREIYTALSVGLRTALAQADRFADEIEGASLSEPLPPGYIRCSVVDLNPNVDLAAVREAIAAALPDLAPAAPPAGPAGPAQQPASAQAGEWYVVRCVYEKPQCAREGLSLVSQPSRPFQLASFFDADAPSRPIRIGLPVDTRPAALRKTDKNVAVMISDELRRQMSRVKGLKQLMEGEMATPDAGGGLICSFSIPIITICALILLMIIVALLNIVFFWLPFFRICLPLPLRAKG